MLPSKAGTGISPSSETSFFSSRAPVPVYFSPAERLRLRTYSRWSIISSASGVRPFSVEAHTNS